MVGSARLVKFRLGSGSARLRLAQFWLGSARQISARLGSGSSITGSARLGSSNFGSARLGSARLRLEPARANLNCRADYTRIYLTCCYFLLCAKLSNKQQCIQQAFLTSTILLLLLFLASYHCITNSKVVLCLFLMSSIKQIQT